MKQNIKFSSFSRIITASVLVLFVVGGVSLRGNTHDFTIFCIIAAATTFVGLYYCPKSVAATENGIILHRLLSSPKVFRYNEIKDVDTCYPSAGGIRLCGSGGFFGYWGYFNDIMFGNYFGYYGSRNNCFIVKMKDGKQYVLGCNDAAEIVGFVNSHLPK